MALKRQLPSRLTGRTTPEKKRVAEEPLVVKEATEKPVEKSVEAKPEPAKKDPPKPEAKPAAEKPKVEEKAGEQTPPQPEKPAKVEEKVAEKSAEPAPEKQPEPVKEEAAPQPKTEDIKEEPIKQAEKPAQEPMKEPVPVPTEPEVAEKATQPAPAEPKAEEKPAKVEEKAAEPAVQKEAPAEPPKQGIKKEVPAPKTEQPAAVQFGSPVDPKAVGLEKEASALPWEAESAASPFDAGAKEPAQAGGFSWGDDQPHSTSSKPEPKSVHPDYQEPTFPEFPEQAKPAEGPKPPSLDGLKPEQTEKEPEKSNPYPWEQQNRGNVPPPELPLSQKLSKVSQLSETMRGLSILGLVGVVLFVGYLLFFKNNEKTTEMLARWTGAYNEVSREVPAAEESVLLVSGEDEVMETGMDVAEEDRVQIAVLEPTPKKPAQQQTTQEPEPILIETMPEEDLALQKGDNVSMANRLQDAIAQAREKNRRVSREDVVAGGAVVPPTESGLTPEEQALQDLQLRQELEQELAAYRQKLAETRNPALLPKPGKFFNEYREGEMQPPVQGVRQAEQVVPPPQQTPYNANPNNLPVVPEPEPVTKPQVRTLSDFKVEGFEPNRQRVRIPRGVSPQMSAATFPNMNLLSLVPNRGLVAEHEGRQGVLLIGETLKGWELIAVHREYAEFQNGVRTHTVTLSPEIPSQPYARAQ